MLLFKHVAEPPTGSALCPLNNFCVSYRLDK